MNFLKEFLNKAGIKSKHFHCVGYFTLLLLHPMIIAYWLLFLASLLHVMIE